MTAIKLDKFGGSLPAWQPQLLPDGQAADCTNTYLFSGALKGWRQPKLLRQLTNPDARMAFRLPVLSEKQALAFLVFTGNPSAGDTVTIGSNKYIFATSITALSALGTVLIGASVTATVTNLIAAITTDNGTNLNAGTLYAKNTVASNDVKWYSTGETPNPNLIAPTSGTVTFGASTYSYMQVGAPDFGAAFNLTSVLETSANLLWLADLASITDVTTTLSGGTNAVFTNDFTGASTWLEFADADTNVIKSQVADDKWSRYYTASPSQVPSYNPLDRILSGLPFWYLGVPAPGAAPVVSVTGGGNRTTVGYPIAAGTSNAMSANQIMLTKFTPPGDTGVTNVQFRSTNASTTAQLRAVIYQDNNGSPGALFAFSEIFVGFATGSINLVPFRSSVGVSGGLTYWIGIASDTAITFTRATDTNSKSAYCASTFANGAPSNAPAVTTTNTLNLWGDAYSTDVITAREYVYTWVTAYDEEGPPSPAGVATGWSNGSWVLGLWSPSTNDLGVLRNITSVNIYRTVVGTDGSTAFFLVANVPVGTAIYTDTATDPTVAANSILPSTTWFPPPANLQGLIAMPNGIMAGFVENQIWFCEPYHPHAWPPNHTLSVEFPVVGLGLTNGALVVCTATTPYVIQGNVPGAMALTKCSQPLPCSSRGSIVSGDDFVTYHSQRGLVEVTPQGVATNQTDIWVTREQWSALTPQQYLRAVYLASCYFAFGSVSPTTVVPTDNSQAQTGFTLELGPDFQSFSIWPHPGGHRLGFTRMNSPTGLNIANVQTDPWTGVCFIISNGAIYYYDFADQQPTSQNYIWRSKIYQPGSLRNFGAMKVFFTVPPGHAALNATRLTLPANDPAWLTLGSDRYGYIKTYADFDGTGNMVLVDCREIRKSGELLRIISGFKAEQWQWEIVSNVVISNVQIASSAKELSAV